MEWTPLRCFEVASVSRFCEVFVPLAADRDRAGAGGLTWHPIGSLQGEELAAVHLEQDLLKCRRLKRRSKN